MRDPLSALLSHLLRAGRGGNPCGDGLSPVSSGPSRFDVALEAAFRMWMGPSCRAKVRPIAGHRRSGGPPGGFPAIVIAFPASADGALRLLSRIETALPIGTLVIRRQL